MKVQTTCGFYMDEYISLNDAHVGGKIVGILRIFYILVCRYVEVHSYLDTDIHTD